MQRTEECHPSEEIRIEAIENAAVSTDDAPGILNTGIPFECGFNEIAGLRGDARQGADQRRLPPEQMQRLVKTYEIADCGHDDQRAERAFDRLVWGHRHQGRPANEAANHHRRDIGQCDDNDDEQRVEQSDPRDRADDDKVGEQFADVQDRQKRVGSPREVALLLAVHPQPKGSDDNRRKQDAFPLMQEIECAEHNVRGDAESCDRKFESLAFTLAKLSQLPKRNESDNEDERVKRIRVKDRPDADRGEQKTDDDTPV